MELVCQGAESRIYSTTYLERPTIMKERLQKQYRVIALDMKINKQRLLQEVRCLVKCRRAGICVPCVYLIDTDNNRLYMERIIGKTLKEFLWQHIVSDRDLCLSVAQEVGVAIAKIHESDVVHGDLTTSNFMVQQQTRSSDGSLVSSPNVVVVIDFGLGMMKPTLEDKAVDLYVLERAFISTHPGSEFLVSAIMESYRFTCRRGSPILNRLDQVRQRGRKRDMNG